MTQYEAIYSSHPILKSFKEGIHLFEQVEKRNRHGVFQTRFLVIHTSGLFLLEAKTFQRSYFVSRIIPFYSLHTMIIKNDILILKSNDCEMELNHKKHLKYAAMIYCIRILLYDHQNAQFTFDIDPKLRETFDSHFYNFTSNCPIADRFLGMCLCNKSPYDDEQVKLIYEKLCSATQDFIITKQLASNQYCLQLISAISLGLETNHLILEDFDIGVFLRPLQVIFNNSTSIRKITFERINFQSNLQAFDNFIPPTHLIKLNEIVFDECRITNKEVKYFFESFSKLNGAVKTLHITGCMLTRFTLDIIFQALFFFSQAFQTLEEIYISDVSIADDLAACVFQLLCCGWVLEKHTLKTLSLRNCSLAVDDLLQRLKDLDTGLVSLDLGRNPFIGDIQAIGFHSLSTLVLDGCVFAGERLADFMRALSQERLLNPIHIDLSNLVIDAPALSAFYRSAPAIKVTQLSGLVWDGNPLLSSQIGDFVTFLKLQTNLVNLSISRCIAKSEQQKALPYLIDLVRTKRFEQFSISSTREGSFGVQLVTLIEALLHRSNSLRLLDVTYQGIGDIGMYLILREHGPCLEELWFDGFAPSSADAFCDITARLLLIRTLKRASWPGADVMPVVTKVHIEHRAEVVRRVNALKGDYKARFGDIDDSGECDLRTRIDRTGSQLEMPTAVERSDTTTLHSARLEINLEEDQDFHCYGGEEFCLLEECGDVVGTPTMTVALQRINDKFSVRTLTNAIRKKL